MYLVSDRKGNYLEKVLARRPRERLQMTTDRAKAARFERYEVLSLARRDNGLFFDDEETAP
jgi:hypothetical protein